MDIKKKEEKVKNRLELQPFLAIVACFQVILKKNVAFLMDKIFSETQDFFPSPTMHKFMYLNSFIIYIYIPGIFIFVASSFVACNATYVSNCI